MWEQSFPFRSWKYTEATKTVKVGIYYYKQTASDNVHTPYLKPPV
jgi:hypothetical protein